MWVESTEHGAASRYYFGRPVSEAEAQAKIKSTRPDLFTHYRYGYDVVKGGEREQ
jgi:hypothetical protein